MNDTMENFEKESVPKAVLKNVIPAMGAAVPYLWTSRRMMREKI